MPFPDPNARIEAVGASRLSLDQLVIGRSHLAAKFEAVGVAPSTFEYKTAAFNHDGNSVFGRSGFRLLSETGKRSSARSKRCRPMLSPSRMILRNR